MSRLNILLTGYSIADEVINRTSSASLKLAHDTIRFVAADFEIWTGASKTGTKLAITTDYTLSDEDTALSALAGVPVYTKLAIVNGAFHSMSLYTTYKTSGDYTSVENITEIALEGIAQAGFTADTAPLDADEVLGFNSTGSLFNKIRTTWTNIKAFLKTYFDGLYQPKCTRLVQSVGSGATQSITLTASSASYLCICTNISASTVSAVAIVNVVSGTASVGSSLAAGAGCSISAGATHTVVFTNTTGSTAALDIYVMQIGI